MCSYKIFLRSHVMFPRPQGMLSPKPSPLSFCYTPQKSCKLEMDCAPLLLSPIHFLNISKHPAFFTCSSEKGSLALPQPRKPQRWG
ncbi:hypothetical protein DV515_00007490 [Chloebia gouldiae]|uniref:Uncharacterized protein n=1 Tax=Chloebia gouldiae TaxID=44316 RepID=A0A3L8SHU4_CHLGU|nr:hypothetical protein DV515_00007490 [Chloebia gouldiae]